MLGHLRAVTTNSCCLWHGLRVIILKLNNLNKLLVFEALYPELGENADPAKLNGILKKNVKIFNNT